MKYYSIEKLKQMSEKYNLSIELINILLNESTREIAKYLTPQNKADIILFSLEHRQEVIDIMEKHDLFNANDILNCITKKPSSISSMFAYFHKKERIDVESIIVNNFDPSWYQDLAYYCQNELAYHPIILQKCLPEAINRAIKHIPYTGELPNLIIDSNKFQRGVIDWMEEKRKKEYNSSIKNTHIDITRCSKKNYLDEWERSSISFVAYEMESLESIEKLANNKKFMKMLFNEPSLYGIIPFVLDYCDNLDDELMDDLSKIKGKCKNKKNCMIRNIEYDNFVYGTEWKNGKGNLIKFFSFKGDFPIKSKSDYYRIYNKYLEEKTSVANFCKKYGISSTEGFQKMLDRISEENVDDKEQITDVKKNVQNKFFQAYINQAEKIAQGEITLEKFLSNPKINFNSLKINRYFDYISDDLKNKLSLIIYDYIEKNQYLISRNFVSFLTNDKVTPIDNLKKYIRPNLKMPKDKEYIQGYGQILSKMKKHEKKYNRRELYSTYIVEGKEYNINDEVIDQAYAYAKDNDYYISYFSMNYLCKQIVTGKLTYSKETKQQKEEMIDDITNLILEEKTIEDYIREMEERATKKHL